MQKDNRPIDIAMIKMFVSFLSSVELHLEMLLVLLLLIHYYHYSIKLCMSNKWVSKILGNKLYSKYMDSFSLQLEMTQSYSS